MSREQILRLRHLNSLNLPRCLQILTESGVADALGEEPESANVLAARVGVNANALNRMLRFVAGFDIFEQVGECYRHSDLSRLMRRDHPQSQRPWLRLAGTKLVWDTYRSLGYSLRTGLPSMRLAAPDGVFAYLSHHPDEAWIFDEAMNAKARADAGSLLSACDFSRFGSLCDVGGGRGFLLQSILQTCDVATGVLFELPHVIEGVAHSASERLSLQAGDFFTDTLPACEAYILMNVIHDWDDADAVRILSNVRRSAAPGDRLLLVEFVMPEVSSAEVVFEYDIMMLALGGRERSEEQYRALMERSGWQSETRFQAGNGLSVLEASAAIRTKSSRAAGEADVETTSGVRGQR